MKKNQWAKLREKLDKKGAALHEAKKKLQSECPHCHFIGSKSNMIRWHFDNCKIYCSLV